MNKGDHMRLDSGSWGEEGVEKGQLPIVNWEQHVEAHDQFLNQKKFLISNFLFSLATQKPTVQGQYPMVVCCLSKSEYSKITEYRSCKDGDLLFSTTRSKGVEMNAWDVNECNFDIKTSPQEQPWHFYSNLVPICHVPE